MASCWASRVIGYTIVTLVGMAQYGKETWRRQGETFSVWFATLGRIAPFARVDEPEDGRVHRRPFASGLVSSPWSIDRVVLVAFGTGSILYDGGSQTRPFFDIFGFPNLFLGTVILGAFLAVLTGLILLVGRRVGIAAIGAGLAPVALGYLVAHYFTFLLIDGQRILVALSDPFQQGWNLIGFANYEPSGAWLPTSVVWGIQVAAVVLGHVVGAWAGHAWAGHAAIRSQSVPGKVAAAGKWPVVAAKGASAAVPAAVPSQLPLALLMIVLTSATLWSLGQNIVFAEPAA